MKSYLTLISILFLSTWAIAQIPPALIGTWRGDVIEPGRSDWYPVVLTVNEGSLGEVVAAVFYPAYSCGGELTLKQYMVGKGLMLEEKLTEGVFSCINHGTVEVQLAEGYEDRAHFKWSHGSYSHVAIGVLQKQEL